MATLLVLFMVEVIPVGVMDWRFWFGGFYLLRRAREMFENVRFINEMINFVEAM